MTKKLWYQFWRPLVFTSGYLLVFSVYYIFKGDAEFIWYVAVTVLFFALILGTIKYTRLSHWSIWGLSLWGLLHMAGGSVLVAGDVLYAYRLLPLVDRGGEFFILKFDQVVHAFGFAVATLVMYEITKRYFTGSRGLLVFIAALGGLGLGAINELVEFAAVVFMPSTGVGGYFNTGLDLVFNAVGAIFMAVMLYWKPRLKFK